MRQLVSVIMPDYNEEKYIAQAIKSVLDQSYENWELLIIDDGSIYGTADVVARLRDQRIRYVFQDNHGVDLVAREYVTTLDVDDWYTPIVCRIALIASKIGQVSEWIRDGRNGLLCPPENGPVLAASIERLIDNPTLRHQMGVNARADVLSNHSWEDYLDRLVFLCNSVQGRIEQRVES